MLKNYIKIAWRNVFKNKKSSFINIAGLAMGMAVFVLIALWIWDELSYDKYHKNYDRIGQIFQANQWNGETTSQEAIAVPLGVELRTNYKDNFDYVVLSSWLENHVLSDDKQIIKQGGMFMDVDAPKLFSLNILKGSINGLNNPNSIMLSASTAKALFGNNNPINELVKIDQTLPVKVTAVYEDLPYNTKLRGTNFIAPWQLFTTSQEWVKNATSRWDNNSFQLFVQIKKGLSFAEVSKHIVHAKSNRVSDEDKRKFQPQIILHPMKDWHLLNDWKDGKVVGGLIEYVRLFAIIGVFVLLLACINFMNLSTARSEKRAKEVGVRKTVGSPKKDLIFQFLSESMLIACFAFFFSIIFVVLALPWFNEVADKQMSMPWNNGWFWLGGFLFTLLTGLIAGSYPAFYLSSFKPLIVLKGTFKVGKSATLPRKVLVVTQFTISIALIVGTLIVFQQIQYTQNRPVGYNRDRLMTMEMSTPDFNEKFDVLRSALKEQGAIEELSESSSPLTQVNSRNSGYDWEGRDPDLTPDFAVIRVTHEFGKMVDWKLKNGRDFSRDFATDSNAIIINEAAVKFMGIQNPIGKSIKSGAEKTYQIIGVVKDLVTESPFSPVMQTFYFLDYKNVYYINLKLNSQKSTSECLATIEKVFKQVLPNEAFAYTFVDSDYANKFAQEERVGKLASVFASLAVIISALGIFGLASFVAEQRTKEIGIRKIIGASFFQLWQLLSKEFILLVGLSCLIAIPIAYYYLHEWLQKYNYHTSISWWIFAITIVGSLLLTIIIVSLQTIKTVRANPVKSLRSE
ncbi:ABC transporter permease [Olivibacter domesticus]|uniref:ABC-type antimicrobial peptide transport system, permease component n=1 Tax=Olivibacter domesticus TaxID=407022 RepID=A0A1H7SIA7_OLID1|nr:ABC transporter permease [Olivibacter domesticus]SEL71434.1 ABC-type antimicrobial peptide transport system, permease component [Olivibacter domesticus]